MTEHRLVDVYRLHGQYHYEVVCSCGWKRRADTRTEAKGTHAEHVAREEAREEGSP